MFLFTLICLYLTFFITVINAQSPYSPNDLRAPERGILIDKKIIIFDSADFGIKNTNAFSLDLSTNWTVSEPAFTKIDNLLNAPTFRYTAFSALKNNTRSLIYAFGGLIPTNESNWNSGTFVNDFYQIDVTSYPISISSVKSGGALPSRCAFVSSIFDDKGKLYIWGGNTGDTTDQAMYIFDTVDSTWSRVLSSYIPAQRSSYSMTFTNGKIYFIGGVFANTIKYVDIREILIYDTLNTNNNPWSIRNATNNTYISDRYFHSAVLVPNSQQIILYGGSLSNHSGVSSDYLITLDLQTDGGGNTTESAENYKDYNSKKTTIIVCSTVGAVLLALLVFCLFRPANVKCFEQYHTAPAAMPYSH
ncbi:5846_t:CDS:2 [Ambispora gerdemannii]|uniref:5846_t:CDS:1 n=1 Tax=Ambispora gerdemannii TaxID=144530 RepID=A0A9N9FYU0_9GLOM|nr:5846_t:CDS:2 [Ambispora gerdemannii]